MILNSSAVNGPTTSSLVASAACRNSSKSLDAP